MPHACPLDLASRLPRIRILLAILVLLVTGAAFALLRDASPVSRAAPALQDAPYLERFDGIEGPCGTSSLHFTSQGDERSVVALILFGDDPSEGPIKVECSGHITPERGWVFEPGFLPQGAESAVAVSFTTKMLSELPAPGAIPPDDQTSTYLCENLFFMVVGDPDDYEDFEQAYLDGDEWTLVPLDLAYGAPMELRVAPELCNLHLPLTLKNQ